MSIGIGKAKNILFLVIYYLALTAAYIYWISPHFLRAGFVVSDSIACSIVGLVAALLLSILTCNLIERGKTSDIILIFLILLYFYPQIVLFAHCLNNWEFFSYVMLYLALMLIFNRLIDFGNRDFFVKENANLFVIVVIVLGIFMVAISGAFTGFRISFDLSDYYEYRFATRELAMPTIAKYLFNWAKTVLPIGLTYAVINKKWWLVGFTSIAEMLCFSFDGKKSSLFMFVLAFAISFFYKREMLKKFPIYMIFVNVLLFVEQALRNGESFIGKNILRRMMFIPAYLGWAFYDFFSVNEFDFLRSSILRRFGLQSPYSEGIPRIIGRLYNVTLSSIGAVNANTGLCGDAFSNFGWASLILYPIIIVMIFKVIEKYLANLDSRMQIIISLTVAYSFLSGALFTVLLTNGILLLILLLIIMPRTDIQQDNTVREVSHENIAY